MKLRVGQKVKLIPPQPGKNKVQSSSWLVDNLFKQVRLK